jgi:ComF family protein
MHAPAGLAGTATALFQAVVEAVYPPQCLMCKEETGAAHGLCPDCWASTSFVAGLVCDCCGLPLPGDAGEIALCDECTEAAPVFRRARAAVMYQDGGRNLVLALKHADRPEMARTLAPWMVRAGRELLAGCDLVAPVPLHYWRLLRRKYNQSSELARQVARLAGLNFVPDLMVRSRNTPTQDGRDRAARFANQAGAFVANPRHAARIVNRKVLLIDDVMTTGATLSALAAACLDAGAARVEALVLARVAKDR